MSMKNPLTPSGIEPATFRFVAQHLNHRATAVPKTEVLGEDLSQYHAVHHKYRPGIKLGPLK